MRKIKLFLVVACVAMLAACNTKPAETEKEMKYENETIATIMERRSIRKYKPETVSRETLDKIMECGINAPNGQNKQSWEVRVVDNPEVMAEINAVIAESYGEKAEMAVGCFRGAPVMVFIARDLAYDFSAYDYIVDAIDTVSAKIAIIERAKAADVPVISCMGTGNKLDPSALVVTDIQKTSTCPLARVMRRELKVRGIAHLKVVYSTEPPIKTGAQTETGKPVVASISFVPSVAGLLAAGEVIRDITAKQ